MLHRALCPMHRDLRLAGQLPPLDAPHHMRAAEWQPFREGIVVRSAHGAGSLLDIGLDKVCPLAFVQPCGDACPLLCRRICMSTAHVQERPHMATYHPRKTASHNLGSVLCCHEVLYSCELQARSRALLCAAWLYASHDNPYNEWMNEVLCRLVHRWHMWRRH